MRLNYMNLCSFVLSSTLSMGFAQLPLFLHRFRPIRHSLMASGSNPYASPSSFGSSFSPQQSTLSSLLQQSASASSLLGSTAFFSPNSFGGHHLGFSAPSSSSHHLGFSPASFGAHSSNGHHLESSGLSQLYQQHNSNPLASSSGLSLLADLGTTGGFEGGYDHAELLEDYPGFSNDLNFAGSSPVRFQSPSPNPYSGRNHLFYLQRSA